MSPSSTRSKWVTVISLRTRADSSMITGLTLSVATASSHTRIFTVIISTNSGLWTVSVNLTFASLTSTQRITKEARVTSTDGPIATRIVITWLTLCIVSARIWMTQIGWSLLPTLLEWMTRVTSWTRANGFVTATIHSAFSIDSASTIARISTLESNTGSICRTVGVTRALRETFCVGVTQVVFWTRANGSVISHFAISILATQVDTWISAFVLR